MKHAKKLAVVALAGMLLVGICYARHDDQDDEDQVSAVHFLVLKNYNGKPVRNAAVVVHPVNSKGKQERAGIELKTDKDGTTKFDAMPYGKMRIQVLAPGFQTYGQDFEIKDPTTQITVKLKRPQEQYSIYEEHPAEKPNENKNQQGTQPPPGNTPQQ